MANSSRQIYDYILVLDFEATCDDKEKISQEIIEFPILMVDTKFFEIQSTFHQYVEPQINKKLSEFCTNLTGITNDMVTGKPNLAQTIELVDKWIKSHPELKEYQGNQLKRNFTFLTCGDWDLKEMLPNQCQKLNITYPEYLKSWINVKKAYFKSIGTYPKGLTTMLEDLNLKLDGRHHSGIDDCKNIAKIVKELGLDGHVFENTTNFC